MTNSFSHGVNKRQRHALTLTTALHDLRYKHYAQV